MRDVDPLDLLRGARTAQRYIRGHLGRKKAYAARKGMPSMKKRKTATQRFEKNRQSTVPSFSPSTDTGPGSDVQYGVLLTEQLPVPSFDASAVNSRDSQVCKVKGYHICRDFHSTIFANDTNAGGPMLVNWALIQFKCPTDASEVQNIAEKFFRSSSQANQKSLIFGQVGSPSFAYPTSGDPWEMKLNCLKMNPDNGYNIITRRSRILYGLNTEPVIMPDGTSSDHWQIDYYQKIDKTMETVDRTTARWKSPIYEVFWANPINAQKFNTNPSFHSQIKTNNTHTCFFENVR